MLTRPELIEGRFTPVGNELPEASSIRANVARDRQARILVVDDNADMRDYVTRLLRQRWSVEQAADGAQALEAVRRSAPDLVLTDVMMPNLDGFGLCESCGRIRRRPTCR